ncbi:hypothetical protein EYF80_012884 [Liparis tanakae]|uniref:Uncharacterized protein n=1 Tax=Liparis tanakae TaxID=230148 RepID=A0A4Z2IGD8_9TELE|nr:hypothetical protein EYF80_012884 [Liparis tanakae]
MPSKACHRHSLHGGNELRVLSVNQRLQEDDLTSPALAVVAAAFAGPFFSQERYQSQRERLIESRINGKHRTSRGTEADLSNLSLVYTILYNFRMTNRRPIPRISVLYFPDRRSRGFGKELQLQKVCTAKQEMYRCVGSRELSEREDGVRAAWRKTPWKNQQLQEESVKPTRFGGGRATALCEGATYCHLPFYNETTQGGRGDSQRRWTGSSKVP